MTEPATTTTLESASIAKLMPALVKAKLAFRPAVKDSVNPAFKSKYVSLDGVIDAIDKALLDNGIAVVQQTDLEGDNTILHTKLVHVSGEWIGSLYRVRPVKHDPQGEGSALTYARRYALMALVGIAPEDDDGNAASKAPPSRARQQSAPSPFPEPEADPNEYAAMIDLAQTPTELNDIGADLAKANLPSAAKATLRAAFTARMRALRDATPTQPDPPLDPATADEISDGTRPVHDEPTVEDVPA